ncbi:MAG TPA: PilN domain-containing protein [Candidatus Saccharimonadales bacterium]|jgi:Tfp pilus assembly protein PilN|nr:PilN domain-containing protein [Candidatus Saccharimonadales bacterium]
MSFVQFNLLPDIKLEFDKAKRTRRFVYGLSFLAVAVVVALFIVSFVVVNVLQKKLLNDANKDINTYSQKLKSTPDLAKILTIQNQLGALPDLHKQKHISSRLLAYLPQITPTKVFIGKLDLDTTANTLEITGTADAVSSVNKFVDTIKFTSYMLNNDQSTKKLAFNDVILTKVDRNDKYASYTIDASFDPALFDATNTNLQLVVPKETTTRSVLNAPNPNSPLFNGQTGKSTDQDQQEEGQ